MRALVAFQLTPPLGSSIAGSAAYEEPLIRQSFWPVLAALQLSPITDGHWELGLHLPVSLRCSNERKRNEIAAVLEFAAGSRYAQICRDTSAIYRGIFVVRYGFISENIPLAHEYLTKAIATITCHATQKICTSPIL